MPWASNTFIYQDNNGYLEVLKVCGGALSKDLCVKFTHDNRHSIGNHYEPIVREVGNDEKNPSAEVEIENEEHVMKKNKMRKNKI